MDKIEVKILNPGVIKDAEKMMVFAARLTQRGHGIHNMDDLMELQNKPYRDETVTAMTKLPHGTIQRFGTINVAITGASRRFLAQITRHQAGVTFMSASLQYSDYSGQADFCVPYNVLKLGEKVTDEYITTQQDTMEIYEDAIKKGLDNDSAGYIAPQGLRNILIISANPLAWKHMISQRICRRNTDETRYVMLLIWRELAKHSAMFADAGPFCMGRSGCTEGKMTCGLPIDKTWTADDILKTDFKEVYK